MNDPYREEGEQAGYFPVNDRLLNLCGHKKEQGNIESAAKATLNRLIEKAEYHPFELADGTLFTTSNVVKGYLKDWYVENLDEITRRTGELLDEVAPSFKVVRDGISVYLKKRD